MASQKEMLISPIKYQQKRKTKKYQDENGNKTERIEIRVTKKERKEWIKEAEKTNLPLTQFIKNRVNCKADINPKVAINLVHMNELFNQAEEIMYDSNSEAGRILRELNREYNILKDRIYESCIPKIERYKLKKRTDKIETEEQNILLEVV